MDTKGKEKRNVSFGDLRWVFQFKDSQNRINNNIIFFYEHLSKTVDAFSIGFGPLKKEISFLFGKYLRGHKTDLQQKRPEFSKYCIFGRKFLFNRLIFYDEYDIISMDTDDIERRHLFAKRQQRHKTKNIDRVRTAFFGAGI